MNPLRRVYVRTSVSTHASMPVCVPGVALAAGDRRASPSVVPDSYIDFTASGIGTGVYVSCVCQGPNGPPSSIRFYAAQLLTRHPPLLASSPIAHAPPAQHKTAHQTGQAQDNHGEETIWLTGTQGTRACWCGSGPSRKLSDRRPRENCRSDSFRESSRASGACDAGSRKDEKAGSVQRAE